MVYKLKQYKNGIFGLKFGKFYVIQNSEKPELYDVIRSDNKEIIGSDFKSIDNAQWYITYYSLDEKQKTDFVTLAKMPLRVIHLIISGDFGGIANASKYEGKNKWLLELLLKIRDRKMKYLPELPEEEVSYERLNSITEKYIPRDLNSSMFDVLAYMYNELNMSYELIEYLVKRCAAKNTITPAYLKGVANNWNTKGLKTLEEVKDFYKELNKKDDKVKEASKKKLNAAFNFEQRTDDLDAIVQSRIMNRMKDAKE